MSTFNEGLRNAVRSTLCEVVNDPAAGLALLAAPFIPIGVTLAAAASFLATRYLCNNPPPPQGAAPIPFTGGQCPVGYRVTVTYRPSGGVWRVGSTSPDQGTTQPRTAAANFWGEIGGVTAELDGVDSAQSISTWGIFVTCRGRFTPSLEPRTPAPVQRLVIGSQAVQGVGARVVIQSVTVSRIDNQPDNCGNVPVVIPVIPPSGITRNTNITFTNSNNVNVTIPVGLAFFQAFVDANLNLQIPFTFSITPTVNFNATFNVGTGDVIIQFFPRNAPPPGAAPIPPPGLPPGGRNPGGGDFIAPPPPPPSDPEFNPPPPADPPNRERVIIGAAVTVTNDSADNRSTVFQSGGNPDIIVPDLGMVQFHVRVGSSTFWTINQRVSNVRALIPCPWAGGAFDVRGTPRPGVTWNITPIYNSQSVANNPQ